MVTHQQDFQRMMFMGWALARYNIDCFLETGCSEGETIGYFSKFTRNSGACDLNKESLRVAKNRYPHVAFAQQDAISWLSRIDVINPAFFYLDCTWNPGCPAKDQLPIIFKRWQEPIVFVSGVKLPNGSSGAQELRDLQQVPGSRIIIPKYGMRSDESGYGLIVPAYHQINLPDSWEIV